MAYTADWFKGNEKNWGAWLLRFKGKPNLRFLEVGCFEGRATVWLLENILIHKSATIDTIDTFEGGMEVGEDGAHVNRNVQKNYFDNIAPFEKKVYTWKGESAFLLRGGAKLIPGDIRFNLGSYDFIYIDGSHKSPQVLEDSILAWRLLKVGGILIWDDYGLKRYPNPLDNPAPAIEIFLQIFEGQYKLISKGYQVCIEKV